MYRYIVSAICGILISIGSFAQSPGVKGVLDEISRNNRQLKAYQSYMASQTLSNKTDNNLQDPEVSAFYLPFGEHETGNYSEYQISQRFEFPSVYSARSKRIERQKELLEFEYNAVRQEVLLNAKKTAFGATNSAEAKEAGAGKS